MGCRAANSDPLASAESAHCGVKYKHSPVCWVLLYGVVRLGGIMIELLTETALVEGILEEVGNTTERWTNRWWWKPLRYFVLFSPFMGIGIYYFWFL